MGAFGLLAGAAVAAPLPSTSSPAVAQSSVILATPTAASSAQFYAPVGSTYAPIQFGSTQPSYWSGNYGLGGTLSPGYWYAARPSGVSFAGGAQSGGTAPVGTIVTGAATAGLHYAGAAPGGVIVAGGPAGGVQSAGVAPGGVIVAGAATGGAQSAGAAPGSVIVTGAGAGGVQAAGGVIVTGGTATTTKPQ